MDIESSPHVGDMGIQQIPLHICKRKQVSNMFDDKLQMNIYDKEKIFCASEDMD